jgi:hypothetical protein
VQDLNRTPWKLADFRNLRPDLPAEVLEAGLKVCNQAIGGGLTREQTWDTLIGLSRTHPDGITVTTLTQALEERFARTEFRWEEIEAMGAEDEMDREVFDKCNEAIGDGHTRDDVFDALRLVRERYGTDPYPLEAITDALKESGA